MRTQKDFIRQNNYNRENYDHFNLMLRKGRKAELQEIAKRNGISLNTLINTAIDEYLHNSSNLCNNEEQ